MKTLILGKGYCGGFLHNALPGSSCTNLPDLCEGIDIPFDFNDESTWLNLPEFDAAVLTFKMTHRTQAEKLLKIFTGKRIIILSSARCFSNSTPDEIISESTPLAESPRNTAESIFADYAALLHLGLIVGPGREVKKFLQEGRIKNGQKYINLIHVEDIVNIVKLLLKRADNGRWLVSNGNPLRWHELAVSYGTVLPEFQPGLESRRFNTEKLNALLPADSDFKE